MYYDLKRVVTLLDKYNLDLLVATTTENIYYLSGYRSLSQRIMKGVPAAAVISRSGESALVLPMAELDIYALESWIDVDHVRYYGEFYIEGAEKAESRTEYNLSKLLKKFEISKKFSEVLVEVIRNACKTGCKSVGVDEMGIDVNTWNYIEKNLSEISLRPAYNVFKEIRMVKTKHEIELLRKAAEISQKAATVMLNSVKENMSEQELSSIIEETVVKEGATPFTVLGCGRNSALPNAIPSTYRVKKGDIIRYDGGCEYKGYYSDIAMVASLGEASARAKEYFKALALGLEVALNEVRPGVKTSELFAKAVASVRRAGIPHYKRHHVGHGIGLECYDYPPITATCEIMLEPGMVINLETPYYEIGFGGLQIEVTLVVTEKGYELLTPETYIKELIII